MQTGKPIISCKIGEVGELFTDSLNILFYKEGDYNDFANKIQRLLIDNELYDRLAKESYDFALKNFNYLSYCDDLNLFFHNL